MDNVHDFKMNLPLLAHSPGATVEMDGRPVRGVTGVTVRAGYNGLTNVVMEMQADTALSFSAATIVKLLADDIDRRVMGDLLNVYQEAHREVWAELDYDGLNIKDQPQAQSRAMVKLIELLAAYSEDVQDA